MRRYERRKWRYFEELENEEKKNMKKDNLKEEKEKIVEKRK